MTMRTIFARISVLAAALAVATFTALPLALAGGVDLRSPGIETPVSVANGGTGAATLTSGSVLVGAGTSAVSGVAPGASGNVLTSNGSAWTSASTGVNRFHTPVRAYLVASTSATDYTAVGMPTLSTTGCGVFTVGTNGMIYRIADTAATANTECVVVSGAAVGSRPVSAQPPARFVAASLLSAATANERVWAVAATNNTALPDNDAVASANYCGIRYSTSASDTQWQCCSADGTTASCSALTARAGSAEVARFEVEPGFSACVCRHISAAGVVTEVSKATNLPTALTGLQVLHSITPLTASSVTTRLIYLGVD